MRLLNTLILTCVVMLSGTAMELIEERVGVDPALRGVWAGFLMSTDGGKNWTRSVMHESIKNPVKMSIPVRFMGQDHWYEVSVEHNPGRPVTDDR